jgi:hypothetical protein
VFQLRASAAVSGKRSNGARGGRRTCLFVSFPRMRASASVEWRGGRRLLVHFVDCFPRSCVHFDDCFLSLQGTRLLFPSEIPKQDTSSTTTARQQKVTRRAATYSQPDHTRKYCRTPKGRPRSTALNVAHDSAPSSSSMPSSAVPSAAMLAAANAGNVDKAKRAGDKFRKLAEKAQEKGSLKRRRRTGKVAGGFFSFKSTYLVKRLKRCERVKKTSGKTSGNN